MNGGNILRYYEITYAAKRFYLHQAVISASSLYLWSYNFHYESLMIERKPTNIGALLPIIGYSRKDYIANRYPYLVIMVIKLRHCHRAL